MVISPALKLDFQPYLSDNMPSQMKISNIVSHIFPSKTDSEIEHVALTVRDCQLPKTTCQAMKSDVRKDVEFQKVHCISQDIVENL